MATYPINSNTTYGNFTTSLYLLIKRSMGVVVSCFLLSFWVKAQQPQESAETLSTIWDANWITHPDIKGDEYGVYLFKRRFTQYGEVPEEFTIHVSADNRYKLYVNGTYITAGPARGDRMNWRFETINIAPFLKSGDNVVSAVVWNFGDYRPYAQHSTKTGFILQGNSQRESKLNTNEEWEVHHSRAHLPFQTDQRIYLVTGAKEEFDSTKYPWGWDEKDYDGFGFVPAINLSKGVPLAEISGYGIVPSHVLVKRNIPLMEEVPQRFETIRKISSKKKVSNFISGNDAFVVPPNTKISVLIDQGHLTNAYPILEFSKGKESFIKITYAESLIDANGNKNNRNEVEGKTIVGEADVVRPDGGTDRVYETLWWRTFRYVQLDIVTKDEELILNDFSSRFTGYPFKEVAQFNTAVPLLDSIWDVSWRTQRLCSGENYFDCPYYEQLQYTGDTRIQSLITTYISGDTRLYKNAIASFQDSQEPFGLTQSRYPSNETQFIPTFSLVWITMLHDYWMLQPDEKFVESMMPNVLDILEWFEMRKENSGLLGDMEWWLFVDWVDLAGWKKGVPPGAQDGNSILINLQYVYTLQRTVELLEHFGYERQSMKYKERIKEIQDKVRTLAWNDKKGMFADTPNGQTFSQHTNTMAILSGLVMESDASALMESILNNTEIAKASYYFSFYLVEALRKTGMEEGYLDLLGPWRDMLENGLTTFAEKPEPTRSDCHAWSASPMYFFLSMVCGIQSVSPGFDKVLVEPHLGSLNEVEGKMPHHLGEISFDLKRKKSNGIEGYVRLPEGLNGVFEWQGSSMPLVGGRNRISFD